MSKLLTDPKPGDTYILQGGIITIQKVEERQTGETCGGVTDGYGVVHFEWGSGKKDSYHGNWNHVIKLGLVVAANEKCWWV